MIKEIEAHARVSFKQQTKTGDVFYTFEYGETRSVSESNDIDKEKERIWNDVNEELNKQIIETKNLYLKN